ncbi:MAG: AI-2E family transporter [Deferribacteres bacterium]|nr:AI-2E family transporter [candidate division KSB1 bacterium]MCB9502765.1 AI-2E family transporter [Deferribacteres bacterium]
MQEPIAFRFSPWKNPANLKLILPLIVGLLLTFFLSIFSTFFFIALLMLLFTSVLRPFVVHLEKRGFNTIGAIILIYTLFLLVIALLFLLIAPQISDQLREMTRLANQLKVNSGQHALEKFISFFAAKLDFLGSPVLQQRLAAQYFAVFVRFLQGAVSFSTTILLSPLHVALLGIAVFFLLKDGAQLQKQIISALPNRFLEFSTIALDNIVNTLAHYFRNHFIILVTCTVVYSSAFYWLNLPYYILLGFLAGFACTIPYFGSIIGASPALLVGLYTFKHGAVLFVLIGVFAAVHFVNMLILKQLHETTSHNIPPLYTLVILLAGYTIWGFWGLFFAMPLAICFVTILKQLMWGIQNFHF